MNSAYNVVNIPTGEKVTPKSLVLLFFKKLGKPNGLPMVVRFIPHTLKASPRVIGG